MNALGSTPEWILHGEPKQPVRNGLVMTVDEKLAELNAKKDAIDDAIIKNQKETLKAYEDLNNLQKKQVETLNQYQSDVKTMSSIEIVKIINDMREEGAAVLAHSDFLKKVVKVLGEEVAGKFSRYYKAENGKQNPCYALPKREAHLMVMSESYKVQAAVYDKMVELEQKAIEPIQAPKPRISISELNHEFKNARELASNRGFTNGQVNDAAVEILKQFVGVDLDAINRQAKTFNFRK